MLLENPPIQKYVAYFRVSTRRQGNSGLGLQAQKFSVQHLIEERKGELIGQYTEVESGKHIRRVELQRALEHCRRKGAALIVAKLDRLARRASFILQIMEGPAAIVFCDYPSPPQGPEGKLFLTQFAAFAEYEGAIISQRTKAGLRSAKANGKLLGSHNPKNFPGRERQNEGLRHGQKYSVQGLKNRVANHIEGLVPLIHQMRDHGASIREIIRELHILGHYTANQRLWNHHSLLHALEYADKPMPPIGKCTYIPPEKRETWTSRLFG